MSGVQNLALRRDEAARRHRDARVRVQEMAKQVGLLLPPISRTPPPDDMTLTMRLIGMQEAVTMVQVYAAVVDVLNTELDAAVAAERFDDKVI